MTSSGIPRQVIAKKVVIHVNTFHYWSNGAASATVLNIEAALCAMGSSSPFNRLNNLNQKESYHHERPRHQHSRITAGEHPVEARPRPCLRFDTASVTAQIPGPILKTNLST